MSAHIPMSMVGMSTGNEDAVSELRLLQLMTMLGLAGLSPVSKPCKRWRALAERPEMWHRLKNFRATFRSSMDTVACSRTSDILSSAEEAHHWVHRCSS